ncbi:putative transcription factor bzip [Golovinomyces cichoracearum]|uniref:Putative transcription factor bzip n=1 Tax=Golovinomyces cichoracearum TaxID=62708 RepID=A0A420IGG0_9PEZI|nr:putative transcription factor bzip [Golovinomyces cichoracearum]
MSQRLPTPHPTSRSPSDDGRRISLPPVQSRDDFHHRTDLPDLQHPVSDKRIRDYQIHQIPSRQIQPKVRGVDGDLGVHSILNPDVPNSSKNPARSPNDHAESMNRNPNLRIQSNPQNMISGQQESAPNTISAIENTSSCRIWATRRILTPKSPLRCSSSSKATLAGALDTSGSPLSTPSNQTQNRGIGPISSQNSPFNKDSLVVGQQIANQQYSQSFPNSTLEGISGSSSSHRPTTTSIARNLNPVTSVNSPYVPLKPQTLSVTAPIQNGQASPKTSYVLSGMSSGNSAQQVEDIKKNSKNPEGPYITPGSSQNCSNAGFSRQTSASDPIHVLTITTNQGLYTIPVDVHHASRLAGEKRARNAGASARFRQRRKEKEKEACSAIEKLESQVRDLETRLESMESERNFYHSERDRLRDILLRSPETRHFATQAQVSPGRHMKLQGNHDLSIGGQPLSIKHHELSCEEEAHNRVSQIKRSYPEASNPAPNTQGSIFQPSGYSVSDIIEKPKPPHSNVLAPSSHRDSNILNATSELSGILHTSYNPSLKNSG